MSDYRRQTRRERALKLLDILTKGPSLFMPGSDTLTRTEFAQGYKGWAEAWVLSQVQDLIPELRKAIKS